VTGNVLVVTADDLPAMRRVLEVAVFVFDPDDSAHRLALELLEALDLSSNTNNRKEHHR